MEPTNQKNLYHLLMDAMNKLDRGEIKVAQARELSNLSARINTAVKLEHDRVRVRIEAEQHSLRGGTAFKLREIEGKNFD